MSAYAGYAGDSKSYRDVHANWLMSSNLWNCGNFWVYAYDVSDLRKLRFEDQRHLWREGHMETIPVQFVTNSRSSAYDSQSSVLRIEMSSIRLSSFSSSPTCPGVLRGNRSLPCPGPSAFPLSTRRNLRSKLHGCCDCRGDLNFGPS